MDQPFTGPNRRPFSWAKIGDNTICLNVGGDITLTTPDRTVILLGPCHEGSDDIPNLITLLQQQMNCVRGI